MDELRTPSALLSISIHALREEGDICSAYPSQTAGRFLSTPSARRATTDDLNDAIGILFLSTPSARRATQTRSHCRR